MFDRHDHSVHHGLHTKSLIYIYIANNDWNRQCVCTFTLEIDITSIYHAKIPSPKYIVVLFIIKHSFPFLILDDPLATPRFPCLLSWGLFFPVHARWYVSGWTGSRSVLMGEYYPRVLFLPVHTRWYVSGETWSCSVLMGEYYPESYSFPSILGGMLADGLGAVVFSWVSITQSLISSRPYSVVC